jgi:hypothetical protein
MARVQPGRPASRRDPLRFDDPAPDLATRALLLPCPRHDFVHTSRPTAASSRSVDQKVHIYAGARPRLAPPRQEPAKCGQIRAAGRSGPRHWAGPVAARAAAASAAASGPAIGQGSSQARAAAASAAASGPAIGQGRSRPGSPQARPRQAGPPLGRAARRLGRRRLGRRSGPAIGQAWSQPGPPQPRPPQAGPPKRPDPRPIGCARCPPHDFVHTSRPTAASSRSVDQKVHFYAGARPRLAPPRQEPAKCGHIRAARAIGSAQRTRLAPAWRQPAAAAATVLTPGADSTPKYPLPRRST